MAVQFEVLYLKQILAEDEVHKHCEEKGLPGENW